MAAEEPQLSLSSRLQICAWLPASVHAHTNTYTHRKRGVKVTVQWKKKSRDSKVQQCQNDWAFAVQRDRTLGSKYHLTSHRVLGSFLWGRWEQSWVALKLKLSPMQLALRIQSKRQDYSGLRQNTSWTINKSRLLSEASAYNCQGVCHGISQQLPFLVPETSRLLSHYCTSAWPKTISSAYQTDDTGSTQEA